MHNRCLLPAPAPLRLCRRICRQHRKGHRGDNTITVEGLLIRFCAASATPKTGSLARRSAHATGNSSQPPNGVPDCRLPPTKKRRRASSASLSDKCANEKHGCTLVRLNRIGSLILKATRRIGEQRISPPAIRPAGL